MVFAALEPRIVAHSRSSVQTPWPHSLGQADGERRTEGQRFTDGGGQLFIARAVSEQKGPLREAGSAAAWEGSRRACVAACWARWTRTSG